MPPPRAERAKRTNRRVAPRLIVGDGLTIEHSQCTNFRVTHRPHNSEVTGRWQHIDARGVLLWLGLVGDDGFSRHQPLFWPIVLAFS